MWEKIKMFFSAIWRGVKVFIKSNSGIMKALRTLVEVAAAWAISMLPVWLGGAPLPPEIQVAVIGVCAAVITAVVNTIGKHLDEGDGTNVYIDITKLLSSKDGEN